MLLCDKMLKVFIRGKFFLKSLEVRAAEQQTNRAEVRKSRSAANFWASGLLGFWTYSVARSLGRTEELFYCSIWKN